MMRALLVIAAALPIAAIPTVRDIQPGSSSAAQTGTEAFDVGGVRVILRRSNTAGVVVANLYLLGGSRQLTAENAGIEALLLEASEQGTRSYPRDVLRRRMSRLGSSIAIDVGEDWSMIGLRTTSDRFDSTWAILADRVMHPTLPAAEVELVRQRILAALAQRRDDSDALARHLADSIAHVGHPYAVAVNGTASSVGAITIADLRAYQRREMVTSRMLLVVVGDVERSRLESLVGATLARLPRGTYRWTPPPAVPRTGAAVVVVHRALPTNYIVGYFPGPLANDRDAAALRIATTALTGRMFAEIRTRRNLTYDVHAPFLDRAATAGGLYVSTVAPDVTLRLMRDAVRELQRELLDPDGLHRMGAQYITDYFLDNETYAAQANFLARAEIYRGNWRLAERFVDELRAVTPEQVQSAARRYMRDIRFAFVGDSTRSDRRLLTGF